MDVTSPQIVDDVSAGSAARAKRANNACRRCRERKVRCSGIQPCQPCANRQERCIYGPEDRKIMVSEKYLAELRRRAADSSPEPPPPAKRPCLSSRGTQTQMQTQPRNAAEPEDDRFSHDKTRHGVVGDKGEESRGFPALSNPLSCGPSEFVTDPHGRRRFLGPSSTWAYSQQVMHMMRHFINHVNTPEVPLNIDGCAFTVDSPALEPNGPLSMGQLPSLDFSLYLINTVKFRLGQLYHLFDERIFSPQLYEFYAREPRHEPLPESRLWYIQYLLLMALGKAFLYGFNDGRPTGMNLMPRALELLPDTVALYQDPILSVEILCCLGLYLQSLDHRNSAYAYIGLAMRVALSQGLHREMVRGDRTDAEVQRNCAAWWTVYILDRKFSSLMGAPTSIQDEDITVGLPYSADNTHTEKALRLHVTMSRLLATVVDSVYGVDGKLGPSFLKKVQRVLRSMAAMAPELEQAFEITLDGSVPISRVAATLNLYYHQCVVLATRPLLICLLRDSLEQQTAVYHTRRDISEPIKALLKTSQESAHKSLSILTAVESQQLLDTFLPFDLESTFSCAFVISLMSAIPSIPVNDVNYAAKSFALLDNMIKRGNTVAQYRKEELGKLLRFFEVMQVDSTKPPAPTNNSNLANSSDTLYPPISPFTTSVQMPEPLAQPLLTLNGLSPDNMLSVAGLLDWAPGGDLADYAFSTEWLWTAHEGTPPAAMNASPGPALSIYQKGLLLIPNQ
ncbi:fungal-specific transcription factor domain-containing protein [Astrocystis sublimbata]|nr:fungal-specific transcription factor domain-containing protein [Astrocystis sublimbata]